MEPAPHQYPALHGAVQLATPCVVAFPKTPAGHGVQTAVEAPPDEYDPIGHGVALPPPTTPWLVVEPARQYHPAAHAPPAVAPVALVEPVPHQYPALHGAVQLATVSAVAFPKTPAGHGVHSAPDAPPVEYDPIGHGAALPPPTTPWFVVEPARQYHPGAQLPPAVAPIALVEPTPHQYPELQGAVQLETVSDVAIPKTPA